ncbi:MAG: response regulator, partial [Deltaproteobacteria bacterium]|nr:response regulator [Deltaproteobacteria bacterium]
ENPAAALSLLASGMHDAALLARLQGLYLVERFRLGNIEMVESSLPPQQCGFAVREGDTALLARLNDGQAILRVNGRYRQIHDRWFGRFDERGDAGYQHLRRLLIWVLVLLTLLLVIVLVWLHSLKQLVHQRTEALQSELAEREKIEQTLREREEDYRRMFDAMADGLLIARVEDGAVLAANRAACEQHRRSSDEFRQLRLDEVVRREPSSDGDELSAVAPRPRATWPGGPACQPAAGLRPDDSTFDAELYRVPCRFQGKEAQLCVIRDVTERRQLEDRVRRAEKMESLGRLAAGVAHDLNNVLSGLVGYPDLILYDLPATSPLTGPLKTIKAAGERAAAIVQDLLVMARRGVASYTPLNLNVLVEQFLRSPEYLRLQTAHPRTRITVELDSGLLPLNGSVVHLTKSLTNLVANAMEAMPEGGAVVIRTENRYLDQPFKGYDVIREGEYVCLSVADTGTGIGEEQLQHIFEPFYTRKVMGRSGTGLGLTLVWGTVSDHQGYIDVQSTPGKGSVFSLYIPATRSQPVVAAAECSLDTLRSTGQSVLVVDDVAEQRSIACGMLRALGYATREAASGLEAVAALQEQPADLLLLDMIMDPGIDGLETYRRILEFRPGQKAILVSGYAETERAREARKLGAGSYVRKPYVLRQLAEAVHRELQGRQPTLRTPSPPASTPGESSRSSS